MGDLLLTFIKIYDIIIRLKILGGIKIKYIPQIARNPCYLEDSHNKNVVGIDLGSDVLSFAHDRGCDGILRLLGIQIDPLGEKQGIDALTATEFPIAKIKLMEINGYKVLLLGKVLDEDIDPEWIAQQMSLDCKGGLRAAWDRDSFVIAGFLSDAAFVQELYGAFMLKDVAVWVVQADSLGGGLLIMIPSRLSNPTKEEFSKDYEKVRRLYKAVSETGVLEKIAAANALQNDNERIVVVPHWVANEEREIIFYVVPSDPKKNHSGLWRLQDLLDWIEGRGAIPKKKKQ